MKYGLIGKTLVHSYSKEIHEALGKYQYELYSLTPEEMPDFVKSHDFGGLNVTIPYKQDVIKLCDEITELAQAIGAVNTLYRKNGRLIGHNTDYEGFLYTAKRSSIDFCNKTVLILGTGGTSLMARKAAADEGASNIYIASRTKKTEVSGCYDLSEKTVTSDVDKKNGISDGPGDLDATRVSGIPDGSHCPDAPQASGGINISCNITYVTYDELSNMADLIEIIVNTTPVGTFPNNMQSIISLKDFPHCEAVIDVIYNPFKTKLLLEAEKLGLKYANGLPMLVAQATAAAGYFVGKPGTFTLENERIISALHKQMQNIVLIGMPGSGKSTVGQHLSEITGKKFVDMDEEIVKKEGMSIPEIFKLHGEGYFRDVESHIAHQLGKEKNLIIATGGGAILRSKNVDALKQNSLIVHVSRPVSSLPTEGRPLSKDLDALMEMEQTRMPLYNAAADITFDNSAKCTKKQLKTAVAELLTNIENNCN